MIEQLHDHLAICKRDTVWVAGAGSREYNLDTDRSDTDIVQIVYPTFVDLYSKYTYQKELTNLEGNIDLKTYDYRELPNLFYKQSLDVLQLLYAFYQEIGMFTKHTRGMTNIINMRTEICRMNLFKFYKSNFHTAKHKIERLKKSIKEDGTYDGKEAMFVYRILNIMVRFAQDDFVMSKEIITATSMYRTFLLGLADGGKTFTFEQAMTYIDDVYKHVEALEDDYQHAHHRFEAEAEITLETLNEIVQADVKEYILMYPNKI